MVKPSHYSPSQRGVAAIIHASGMFGPFFPVLLWLSLRKSSPLLHSQGPEALNFQIQAAMIEIPIALLSLFFFGGLPVAVFYLYRALMSLWAAISVASDATFRYPAVFTRWIPSRQVSR